MGCRRQSAWGGPHRAELDQFPVEGDVFLAPGAPHRGEVLFEQFAALLERDANGCVFLATPADSDTHEQASPRQLVDGGQAFGQGERVMQ